MKLSDFLRDAGHPVAYYPKLATCLTGSVNAALLLCQLFYWHDKTPDGWTWKSIEQITEETGMSRKEQETARRILLAKGLIEEKRAGIPRRLYFRVKTETLDRLWEAGTAHTSMPVSGTMGSPKAADSRVPSGPPSIRLPETPTRETDPRPQDFEQFLLQAWGREGRVSHLVMEGFVDLAREKGWPAVRAAIEEAAIHNAKNLAYVRAIVAPGSRPARTEVKVSKAQYYDFQIALAQAGHRGDWQAQAPSNGEDRYTFTVTSQPPFDIVEAYRKFQKGSRR